MIARMAGSGPIPIVDLSAFTTGKNVADDDVQRAAADELIKVCAQYGCAGVVGHGLSASTLSDLWKTSRQLFSMSLEDKMKAPHPVNSWVPHRGYTPVGGEKAFNKQEMTEHGEEEDFWKTKAPITDHKEIFDIGDEDNKTHGKNIFYPESMFPGLREFSLRAHRELHEVCMNILEAFLLGLSLTESEKNDIRDIHSGGNDHLRLLHYPSLPSSIVEIETNGRFQPHQDWRQDSCGGLEFEDYAKEGVFIPATPVDDMLYLNIGEMLTRMSNDLLPSPLHRVIIPAERVKNADGETVTPDRYSIAFFMQPDDDKVVATPESLVKAHGSMKYEPTTLTDYAAHRAKWLFKKE